MWGLFSGFARKQPPHLLPVTEIPIEPLFIFMILVELMLSSSFHGGNCDGNSRM